MTTFDQLSVTTTPPGGDVVGYLSFDCGSKDGMKRIQVSPRI